MVFFHLFHCEVVLIFQGCLLPHCFQVGQLFQVLVFSFQSAGLGVELCRVDVKVIQILGTVFPVAASVESDKLFLVGLGRQVGSQKRIFVFPALVLLPLHLLSHFLILVEVINHVLIHLGSVPVPAISLHLPTIPHFLHQVISSNPLVRKPGSDLARSLCALLLLVTHGSAVLASAFAVLKGLMPFLPSLIPLLQEAFGFEGRNLD